MLVTDHAEPRSETTAGVSYPANQDDDDGEVNSEDRSDVLGTDIEDHVSRQKVPS